VANESNQICAPLHLREKRESSDQLQRRNTVIQLKTAHSATLGMLIVHFFTFDPGWIRSPRPAGEQIFFDGHCGLCHGFVRFVLQEDQSGEPFSFAPLQGQSVQSRIPDATRAHLPDRVVVMMEQITFTRDPQQ
jgi:hypothetical protein